MYNKKTKIRIRKSARPLYWVKKRMLTIITAFMLGLSNSLNDEDKSVFDNHYRIEQQDEKD